MAQQGLELLGEHLLFRVRKQADALLPVCHVEPQLVLLHRGARVDPQVELRVERAAPVADLEVDAPALVVLLRQLLYLAGDADGYAVAEVREGGHKGANGGVGHRVPHEVEVYVLGCAAPAPRQRAHQDPSLDRHSVAHAGCRQLREDHVLADARGRVEAGVALLALVARPHLVQVHQNTSSMARSRCASPCGIASA